MSQKEIAKGFPAYVSQPVQWGEQDGFGHINNMHFIRWFETARIALLEKCGFEITARGVGPILAAVSCNYRQQVKYPDTIITAAKITKVGRSSMQIEHALWSVNKGEVAADGDSTVVLFDYDAQKSFPISDELRKRIEELHS